LREEKIRRPLKKSTKGGDPKVLAMPFEIQTQVPEEVLWNVVKYVWTQPRTIGRLEMCCRQFRKVLTSPKAQKKLWKRFYIDRWGDLGFIRSLLAEALEEDSWRISEDDEDEEEVDEEEEEEEEKEEGSSSTLVAVDWKKKYSERANKSKNKNAKKKANTLATKQIQSAAAKLNRYEMGWKREDLVEGCNEVLSSLDLNPNLSAETYLLLAYACALRRCFESAKSFLVLAEVLINNNPNEASLTKKIKKIERDILQVRKVNVSVHIDSAGVDEEKKATTSKSTLELVRQGELTEEVEGALTKLFESFSSSSSDNNNSNNNNKDRRMTKQDFAKFVSATNSQQEGVVTTVDPSVLESVFDSGSFETDSEGRLTLFGFLSFYLAQTIDDPNETLNDLRNHKLLAGLLIDKENKNDDDDDNSNNDKKEEKEQKEGTKPATPSSV